MFNQIDTNNLKRNEQKERACFEKIFLIKTRSFYIQLDHSFIKKFDSHIPLKLPFHE